MVAPATLCWPTEAKRGTCWSVNYRLSHIWGHAIIWTIAVWLWIKSLGAKFHTIRSALLSISQENTWSYLVIIPCQASFIIFHSHVSQFLDVINHNEMMIIADTDWSSDIWRALFVTVCKLQGFSFGNPKVYHAKLYPGINCSISIPLTSIHL